MCEDQPAQIDCRLGDCKYHKDAKCTNVSPAITLNPNGAFVCWSKEELAQAMYKVKVNIEGFPTKDVFLQNLFNLCYEKKPILIEGVEFIIKDVELVALPD